MAQGCCGLTMILTERWRRTARHAACKLRGKRRAGLSRARIRSRQTASASSGRLSTWLRSSSVPSVPARSPPRRPSPQNAGPRTCGSVAGCMVPEFRAAGCCATGSVVSVKWVSLCYRLRGATGRLGYRPARRVPALRWSFPPPLVCGFVMGSVLPSQPGPVVGN